MKRKQITFLLATTLLVATGILVATCVGAKSIPIKSVLDSFFHYEGTLDHQLVVNARLPRAILSVIIGGILAIAGAMMQGVTRNPIAEPSILGMTQGAAFAVACVTVTTAGNGILGNSVAAFIGAFISGILVLMFSMRSASNMSMSRLLLAGTALSTFFLSLASVTALLANRSQDLAFWVAGGFRAITWKHVVIASIIGGICLIIAFFLSKKINIVSLGDDVATGLGVSPTKVRFVTILLTIPMCAVSVACAGNIGFVGLIVPHIVRKMTGNDYRTLLPFSFLAGGALLCFADILAKTVQQPYETPVGLFTALMGVPVFLYLVRKENR